LLWVAVLCELGVVFDGIPRPVEWSPPEWWWGGWLLVAFSFAVIRQWQPKYMVHLGWSWTDIRLLLQTKGDFIGPWYSGWWQNAMAGLGLSLGMASMASRWMGSELTLVSVARIWALWGVVMLMRGCVALLWEGLSEGEIPGREWSLLNRYLLESTAWFLAPWGLCLTLWGSKASFVGLCFAGVVWGIGWVLRQSRSIQRITRFKHHPLEGVFYLCALEILPVVVLIRAWQW
jgi:hypothetical protein